MHEDNWLLGVGMGMGWGGGYFGKPDWKKGEQQGDDGDVHTDILEERREEWDLGHGLEMTGKF